MSIDTGRERIDEGRRRRRIDRLTPAAKPGQTGELLAPSPSQESADQNQPRERNESSGPEENAREGTPGRSLFPAWLRRLRYYGLALLFVAMAAMVRWALGDVLSPTPGLVFYLAWVGAAAFGGLGPGLLATLASWWCIGFLFNSPPWQVGFGEPASIARILIFLAGGLAVSVVGERMRWSRIHEHRQGWELAAANAPLRASEDKHRGLVEKINDWVWEIDADGVYTYSSPRVLELLGYPPAEIVGKTPFDLMPPAEAQRTRKAFRPIWLARKPLELFENTLVRKDGRLVTVETSGMPVFAEDGSFLGYTGIDRDVTSRKQVEQDLRESRDRYQALIETTADFIWEMDASGKYTYCSPQMKDLWGYEPKDMIGKTPFDVMPPEDRRQAIGSFMSLAQSPKPFTGLEASSYDSRGRLIAVEISGVPFFDADGRLLGYRGISRDVTERKRAEEALRSSQSMLRLVMENVPQGIFWKDRHSTYLGCNNVFAKGAGLESAAEIVGKTDDDLPWSPEQAASFREYDRRIMENDAPEYHIIEQQREANGNLAWLETNKVPLHDARGQVIGILGTYEVITERQRAEEALREWNTTLESRVAERTKELEQRARQLQKLTLELTEAEERERKRLGEILHDDLQQVLAAAKFQVSLLGSRVKNDADSREIAGQAGNLLIDAIAKSRSLSHELSAPVLSRSDLGEAFEWLAEQMRKKHGFTVHVETKDQIEVASEPLRILLYKAAQELLFNVIKHAGVREATLRLRHRRGRLWLSISDQGRGFDPALSEQALGFGLLSIRERVEYLGGRLKIRSAKDKGSTFLIAMPDFDAREPALSREAPSAPSGMPATEE